MEGNGQSSYSTKTEQRFEKMGPADAARTLQERWQVADALVKNLLGQVENGRIEDVYPIVPHTIVSITAGVFGFAPRGGLIEAELHTKAEAFSLPPARSAAYSS